MADCDGGSEGDSFITLGLSRQLDGAPREILDTVDCFLVQTENRTLVGIDQIAVAGTVPGDTPSTVSVEVGLYEIDPGRPRISTRRYNRAPTVSRRGAVHWTLDARYSVTSTIW
jgi:hypothetical protein